MLEHKSVCLGVLLLTASTLASAHPGHGTEGLAHDFDHLLAALIAAGVGVTAVVICLVKTAFSRQP